VSLRLLRIFAIWFVLQIALPFTAPLQACDLSDLFGHRHSASEPDAATIPALSEADASSFVSPIESSALRASTSVAVIPIIPMSSLPMGSFDLFASPQAQQAVLRV
jgi:hypothetical protein